VREAALHWQEFVGGVPQVLLGKLIKTGIKALIVNQNLINTIHYSSFDHSLLQ
jgi:hypothetical protein